MTAPMMADMPTPDPVTMSSNGHTLHPIPAQIPVPAHPAAPAPAAPPSDEPKPPRRWFGMLLTVLGWAAATILSADGAWNFFRGTLHLNLQLCIAAFALFEISVLACAVTARHRRLASLRKRQRQTQPDDNRPPERHSGGIAGIAVWVFAALSGLFSASHELVVWGQGVRFIAPLMAAFLFELLVSTEVLDAQGRRRKINIRFTPERILVRLGLADPSDRTANDVAQDRTIARLATLCYRAQEAPEGKAGDKARENYQRALERANERYGLAADPKQMAKLLRSISLLYGSLESTTADAVAASNPWSGGANRPSRPSTPPQVGTSGANRTGQQGGRKAEPGKRERVPAEQLLAEYDALKADNLTATEKWLAEQLGVTPQRVRDVKSQFGRTNSTTE